MLICPNCKKELQKYEKNYKCINKHSFDIAKNSYVNLILPNEKNKIQAGDNKDMIKARKDFLAKGYYDELLKRLIDIIFHLNPKSILDAGCGEGYFINNIEKEIPKLIAYASDISKIAINYAAKGSKSVTYFVASSKDLPLKGRSLDLLLNIFAPHFNLEFNRILKKDAQLLKVTPGSLHLLELKNILYNEVYLNDEKIEHLSSFDLVEEEKLTYKVKLESNDDLLNLFMMTPYFYKTPTDATTNLYNQESLEVTLDFIISIFKAK